MHSRSEAPDSPPAIRIRPLVAADRPAVAEIVHRVGNFNAAEIACALELVDVYLGDPRQADYRIEVADDGTRVVGYVCWGPTPMTRGTYDLYWVATDPDAQGQGIGRALALRVESGVRSERGRLLVVETSSKQAYAKTVGFYVHLGFEEASRIRDFYDVGDDKLVFVKHLPG